MGVVRVAPDFRRRVRDFCFLAALHTTGLVAHRKRRAGHALIVEETIIAFIESSVILFLIAMAIVIAAISALFVIRVVKHRNKLAQPGPRHFCHYPGPDCDFDRVRCVPFYPLALAIQGLKWIRINQDFSTLGLPRLRSRCRRGDALLALRLETGRSGHRGPEGTTENKSLRLARAESRRFEMDIQPELRTLFLWTAPSWGS